MQFHASRRPSFALCHFLCALLAFGFFALSAAPAAMAEPAEGPVTFGMVPAVLRPGKLYDIIVSVPEEGMLYLDLLDERGEALYEIYDEYPALPGTNDLYWDGLRKDFSPIEPGEYTLAARIGEVTVQTPLRIGQPYPLISHVRQSDTLIHQGSVDIWYEASVSGTLSVQLKSDAQGTAMPLMTLSAQEGENAIAWDGTRDGERVEDGAYGLILTLQTESGSMSMQHFVPVEVTSADPMAEEEEAITIQDVPSGIPAEEGTFIQTRDEAQPPEAGAPEEASGAQDEDAIAGGDADDEGEEAEATPAPGAKSAPYSDRDDGTYWSMTPGELDHAAIWQVMTQPITVYDAGMDQRDHIYLRENPDGTGAQLAQVHAQSQGLHVLGEVNEHGYVLVEVFSSYDDKYYPDTAEEKAHAFDVKQGYVKASGLKQVSVQQDMGLLIDKKTQRMYLYKDGEPVTEFLISTGVIANDKYYYETTPGEFITVSHTGGFFSGKYMYCDMAIRINGGILLHEVPHEPLGDGSKRYAAYEALLGQKASHGCVRIQRLETPEGYTHRWLWDNLKPSAPYKVIIWDDIGRVDSPTTWQPNPS